VIARTPVVLALGAGLVVAAAGTHAASTNGPAAPAPVWTEVKWPFLMDEWGIGRAFQCKAETCGTDVALYIRPKIGFCNCTTGVTDDDDLDRVGDLSLLSDKFVGLAEGHPVVVDEMTGRSRPYEVRLPLWRSQTAIAVVLHAKCDAVVATIVADREHLVDAEQQALAYLGGETVQHWAKVTLGL
jgi:hypothetical protein